MADEVSVTVKCTNYCGFSVTGEQEFAASLFEHHAHQKESHRSDTHWYEYAFSWQAALVLAVLAMVVAAALDPTTFLKG